MEQKKLEPGVWAILATPFAGDALEVDTESLQRLVGMYRAAGVTGLVALGVLGEAARMSSAERQQVLATVVGAAGDLSVVAGMSALSTAPAIEEACRAAEGGAHATMVQVSTPDPERLAEHLQAISTASGLGVVLQDHPAASGISIPPVALARAATLAGCVVAIKAESPPTAPTIATVSPGVDIPMFGGLGGVSLLDELLAGSAGAMTGFAVPEALVATVHAWEEGGFEAARAAYLPWLPLVLFEAQEKISLSVRKELLRYRGAIRESRVRPPGAPLPAMMVPLLEAHVRAVNLSNELSL